MVSGCSVSNVFTQILRRGTDKKFLPSNFLSRGGACGKWLLEHGWIYGTLCTATWNDGMEDFIPLVMDGTKVGSPGSKFVVIKPLRIHILPT